MQVHRSHGIALQLPDASLAQLQAYLSRPVRPLKALLNRKKVERLEDGRFLYVSRPYHLLNFQLQPEVVFRSSWDGDQLIIVFENCTIHGLGGCNTWCSSSARHGSVPSRNACWQRPISALNCPRVEQGLFYRSR